MANEREIDYKIHLTFSKGTEVTAQIAAVQKQIDALASDKGISKSGPLAALQSQLKNLQTQLQVTMNKAIDFETNKAKSGDPKADRAALLKTLSENQRGVNKAIKDLFADIEAEAAASRKKISEAALADALGKEDPMFKRRRELAEKSTDAVEYLPSLSQIRRSAHETQLKKQGGGVDPEGEDALRKQIAIQQAQVAQAEAMNQERDAAFDLAAAEAELRAQAEMTAPVDAESIRLLRERTEALKQAKEAALGAEGANEPRGNSASDDPAENLRRRADAQRQLNELEQTALQVAEATAEAKLHGKVAEEGTGSGGTGGSSAASIKAEAEATTEAKTATDAKADAEAKLNKIREESGKQTKARFGAFKTEEEVLKQSRAATEDLGKVTAKTADALTNGIRQRNKQTDALNKNAKAREEARKKAQALKDAETAAIKARQEQMEGFASDGIVYSENDLALQKLVAQLVEARDAGGSFDETLIQLVNRISKLAGQSSVDVGELGKQFGLTAEQAERLKRATEVEQASDQFRATFRQTRVLGSTFQGLSGIGAAAGRLGATGVNDALDSAGGIAQIAEQLPRLRSSLKAMPETIRNVVNQIGGPTLGLIGSLIALTLVTELATKADNARAESAKTILEAQAKYFELVQTGTTESINARRKDLQDQRDAAARNRDLLQGQSDAATRALKDSPNIGLQLLQTINPGLVEFGIAAHLTGGEIRQLREDLDKANDEVAGYDKQLTDLNAAYSDGQVALNDYREAMRKLSDELIKNADETRSRIEGLHDLRGLSSDDLEQRKKDLEADNENARQAQRDLGPAAETAVGFYKIGQSLESFPDYIQTLIQKYLAYDDQIEHNEALLTGITSGMIENAKAAEAYKAQIAGFLASNDAYFDHLTSINALLNSTAESVGENIQSLTDEYAALQSASQELLNSEYINTADGRKKYSDQLGRLLQIEQELNDIRANGQVLLIRAAQEFQTAVKKINDQLKADLDKAADDLKDKNDEDNAQAIKDQQKALDDKNDKLAKAQKDADEKTEDNEKEHQKRLQDIVEKYSDDIRDAIRGRNAAAAISAIRAANKARKDEEDRFKDQKEKLAKALKDQQDEIDDAYKKQLKEIKERLDEQLAANEKAYDQQVKNAREQAAKETQAKLDEYNKQTTDLKNFLTGQTQLTSAAQAQQLTDLFGFTVQGNSLINQFVNNALRDMSRLANKGGSTGSSGQGNGNVGNGGQRQGDSLSVNVATTVHVQTNADAEAIAKAASAAAVRDVTKALGRTKRGGQYG